MFPCKTCGALKVKSRGKKQIKNKCMFVRVCKMEGTSGRIYTHTRSLELLRDDPTTTLMAGYMAFRAERCDMQAFTLALCLSHTHLHTCTQQNAHTLQGLPLITADLCTFRLWNDSGAEQRTTSRFASRLILLLLTHSESSTPTHHYHISSPPPYLVCMFV